MIPFEDVASLDFTLKSPAVGYGQQVMFEVDGPTSYRDLGAIQHAGSSSGGGSSTPTAGTQVYPFRQWVEDDFGGGGSGVVLHPLRSN